MKTKWISNEELYIIIPRSKSPVDGILEWIDEVGTEQPAVVGDFFPSDFFVLCCLDLGGVVLRGKSENH